MEFFVLTGFATRKRVVFFNERLLHCVIFLLMNITGKILSLCPSGRYTLYAHWSAFLTEECVLVFFFGKLQKAHINVNYDSSSSFSHHVPGWLFFCFIYSVPRTEACLPVRELNAHRMTGGCRGECVRMQTSVHGTEREFRCLQ